MLRTLVLVILFFTCWLALGKVSPAAQPSPVLHLAYPNFPPFHWKDDAGRMQGMFSEILTEALEKRLGYQVQWTAYPWARCQEQVKNGREDALLTVPTQERSTYTRTHQHPFFVKPLHLFTTVDHPRRARINRLTSLTDIRDGGFSVITYSSNGWHRDHVAFLGIKSHESAYLENVWRMLAEHRGDLVIEWPRGAREDLQRLGLQDRVVDTGIVVASMPFHLLIRTGSGQEQLLTPFDSVIRAMQDDGTLAVIVNRYE
nr:transporter substrate-binding domain-containing protein [uncultured Desulfobulbus sp.]